MTTYPETAHLPALTVTAVGSLPHTDAEAAVDLILGSLPHAPHAPQLSRADPREQMWIQFTEGLPRFHADITELKYGFDTSGDYHPDIEAFYHAYLETTEGGSADAFAVGPEYGRGIHVFLDRLRTGGKRYPVVKAQVTGPLSFALTVTDEKGRAIFYHDVFRDVAVKGMGLKAMWLVDQLKPLADNVIIFFDEPCLSAYGSSAYLGLSKNDVIESLDEVIGMVSERGAVVGVHCCGNTDWGLLMETKTRIINFDAVDYLESLCIYSKGLNAFLEAGGVLAWGAVPNTEQIRSESVDSVARRTAAGFERLVQSGIDPELLRRRMILTPACGCSSLSPEDASKVYKSSPDAQKVLIA